MKEAFCKTRSQEMKINNRGLISRQCRLVETHTKQVEENMQIQTYRDMGRLELEPAKSIH